MMIILIKTILKLLLLLDLLLDVTDITNVKYVKTKKINKKFMPIAWHPTRVWDLCMTKDEKLWNDNSNV